MMDNSIVSTSLYTIALEFNSLEKAIWTVLAYTLSYLGTTNNTVTSHPQSLTPTFLQ